MKLRIEHLWNGLIAIIDIPSDTHAKAQTELAKKIVARFNYGEPD